MYLGPLYYYLIAPSLALFNFSPVGPASFVAFVGVLTVGFVWLVARQWFGLVAAFSSSLLFAISPVVVTLSKHSWNPNIMPFFALLSIYSIWRIAVKKEYQWLLVLGVAYAFVLQSHYLGLLLLPTIFIFLLWTYIKDKDKKFLKYSFLGFFLFALLMSPLFIFDAKHKWQNVSAIMRFFTDRQTTISAKPWNALPSLWPIWSEKFVGRLLSLGNSQINTVVALPLAIFLFLIPSPRASKQALLLFSWLAFGMFGIALYKQSVFDHYFGFMFPALFLLMGFFLQRLWEMHLKVIAAIILGFLAFLLLLNNPLQYPPQRQMYRTMEVDKKILDEAQGKPFNFALIAKQNYEEGYLYFFELWNAKLLEINPQRYEQTRAEQLFVVCEDPCDPVHSPKAEIANFGWSKKQEEWEVDGLKLYKLVPNIEGLP
jgi:4-amino-4-deoxy-L-arabinose transferase-like glycosyltransferase